MSLLEVKNVRKTFGGVKAVYDLSYAFKQNNITALIGANGSGKTTVFNLISGFLKPDSGEILYCGKNISHLPPWRIARLGVGRLFQDVRIFNRMTVKDNVLVAFNSQNGENPLKSIIMPWKTGRENRILSEQALCLLEFVGLADKSEELAVTLSYGQQKLLALARLLALDSQVLLLDEPTSGVNINAVKAILDFIRRLAKKDKIIIVIEHNLNAVCEIADHVCFMEKGQIIFSGPPDSVLGNPEIRAAYIGG